MAEAKGRDDWAHTSSLLAMLANVNRDPKKQRPLKPSDFNPYEPRSSTSQGIPLNKDTIGLLKTVFVKEKGRGAKA